MLASGSCGLGCGIVKNDPLGEEEGKVLSVNTGGLASNPVEFYMNRLGPFYSERSQKGAIYRMEHKRAESE